ncbi:hypothetical protein PNEG_00263 [Pneumocystis murina B123]|uniref:Muskelin N-terminal domain-containing protein n=1 Tax=Pneumocystis murina (strain B123) TaxID=1069680 RepID=M7PD79_PNEMU|nr:hypothetical protein PNEG_00263 [Pneumocystis murina B123]EMR11840.1 hypothetical protein PNEG_00263 [Pneumocystis murina B123]
MATNNYYEDDQDPIEKELANEKSHDILYSIDSWSSYSSTYHPSHILVDSPEDQGSRWSSTNNTNEQYIIIKLNQLSIVKEITFGKYYKPHVCNLKELKVYGGPSRNSMLLVLHTGLTNDVESESFQLLRKSRKHNTHVPILFLKIVPLAVWGTDFNFSIWHVKIHGWTCRKIVTNAMNNLESKLETYALKLTLTHLRRRNSIKTFKLLSSLFPIELEHPFLNNLYQTLVIDGNFVKAELLIDEAQSMNAFNEYISKQCYNSLWVENVQSDLYSIPGVRGGHQMCIDQEERTIYLFGGWDGYKDLSDFWSYSIKYNTWKKISDDTSLQNGPSPRSCHKICFDSKEKKIYVLGKFIEANQRNQENICIADFWTWDIKTEKWECISKNTANDNGPSLIFDHAMCIDESNQIIYVFGGRIVTLDPSVNKLSDFFCYSIPDRTWKILRKDSNSLVPTINTLRSRIGHSMLFEPILRCLFIFAGQRCKEYLSDFYLYDIDKDKISVISMDYSNDGGPEGGFTQRATLNPKKKEIIVLSGLIKDKKSNQEIVRSSAWVYYYGNNIKHGVWNKINQNDNNSFSKGKNRPCPRYAHQLVYDEKSELHFLYGGNPRNKDFPKERLGDFWTLELQKPTISEISRRLKLYLRKQRFRELCHVLSSIDALSYLHNELSALLDHSNKEEIYSFYSLITSELLAPKSEKCTDDTEMKNLIHTLRMEVFDNLIDFFPQNWRGPNEKLIDLIKL